MARLLASRRHSLAQHRARACPELAHGFPLLRHHGQRFEGSPYQYKELRMITRQSLFPVLLDAYPSFAPEWQQFVAEWSDEVELPLYIALGDLARNVVLKVSVGETSDLPDLFMAIERLLTHGDHWVREAATIGLLENLQNIARHETSELEKIRAFLQPESERQWNKLNAFWQHGSILSDD